jgi:signal transduction histidine kinase
MRHAAHSASAPRGRRAAALEAQKRSFLRMVSHELRTPLNSILGFSEILASELYGPLGAPQYKEYAEIVCGSGQKLLKLVNQVLEIARLESQAIDWDLRPQPLPAALEEVISGLAAEAAARDVVIQPLAPDALPEALADDRGLRTVLSGLLQNAITFSPQGSTVETRAQARGKAVELAIENPGEAIAAKDLPRLLEPFEQGQAALTRAAEGAGLGLTICALTCQAMDGRLSLAPRRGGGLIARVRLPAA